MTNTATAEPGKILTATQAAAFLGMSLSYLYKLTHNRTLAYFKPNGKMLYFLESDLVAWVTSNRIASATEIEQLATDYVATSKKGGMR
ncbi:MAG: helix-turn-helix domain-containing protein [Mucinivorans sp.]